MERAVNPPSSARALETSGKNPRPAERALYALALSALYERRAGRVKIHLYLLLFHAASTTAPGMSLPVGAIELRNSPPSLTSLTSH